MIILDWFLHPLLLLTHISVFFYEKVNHSSIPNTCYTFQPTYYIDVIYFSRTTIFPKHPKRPPITKSPYHQVLYQNSNQLPRIHIWKNIWKDKSLNDPLLQRSEQFTTQSCRCTPTWKSQDKLTTSERMWTPGHYAVSGLKPPRCLPWQTHCTNEEIDRH